MRWSIALALLGCALQACADESVLVRAAEVRGYGIFQPENMRPDGIGHTVTGVEFVDFTDKIPGRLGVDFGIKYVVDSKPKGETIDITNVIRFPGKGIPHLDGTFQKVLREHNQVKLGFPDIYGYSFDKTREILPGKWVFEVWVNRACVVRRTFTVVPDREADSLADNDNI
ncbi:MAG TPA: DUF3859 domain-containing protein [Pseudomonadales bacterium]|nr:DUF3859 domain-containing protein [Pseudomonadales bacterium]